MKCPHCAAEIPIHQQFCLACGKKVEVDFTVVADSVRDDVDRIASRRFPVVLAQVVALLVLANVSLYLASTCFSTKVRSGDLTVPAVMPPRAVFDPTVTAECPAVAQDQKVKPLALATVSQVGAARLGFRRDPIRSALHATRGGEGRAQDAAARAVSILAKHQERNGAWTVTGNWQLGRAAWGNAGVTGLAVLALLADGHVWTVADDELGASAGNGVHYLVSVQDEDGRFGPAEGNFMYNQGIATTAVCEAYAMSGLEALRENCRKAIAYIVAAQTPSGGWGYHEDTAGTPNMAVTAWQVSALHAASIAGIDVPEQTRQKALAYIDSLTNPKSGHTGYQSIPKGDELKPEDLTATAASLACRTMLGQAIGSPVCQAQVRVLTQPQYLPAKKEAWRTAVGAQSEKTLYFYFYFAAMGLAHDQSAAWKTFNAAMTKTLVDLQARDGAWPPLGAWALEGGRVYATAMGALALQTPHRYP